MVKAIRGSTNDLELTKSYTFFHGRKLLAFDIAEQLIRTYTTQIKKMHRTLFVLAIYY